MVIDVDFMYNTLHTLNAIDEQDKNYLILTTLFFVCPVTTVFDAVAPEVFRDTHLVVSAVEVLLLRTDTELVA